MTEQPVVTLALTEAQALVVLAALGNSLVRDIREQTGLPSHEVMSARGSIHQRIADAMNPAEVR
jgi:ATP sulfurylase